MNESAGSTVTQLRRIPVLLVDDEPHITASLMRELRAEGLDLTAINDSQDAMRMATAEEYVLIISDNLMPNMTGLEFFGNLKVKYPDTRRILLTGHTDMSRAVQAFNDGDIHRFVSKPWNKEELLNLIRQELKAYQDVKIKAESKSKLERESRQRTEQLRDVFIELKQTKTQLALHQDSGREATVKLSSRVREMALLVVEGHEGVREIVLSTLRKAGIENVFGVESAAEALEHLGRGAPVNLIIAEWKLPDMDGLELFKRIRSGDYMAANVPFILTSTRENRNAVRIALDSGVDSYLIKPFHLNGLLEHIEKLAPKSEVEHFDDRIRSLRDLYVVVVNSDLDSRTKVQNLLVASGFKNVITSPTGIKAVRLVETKHPDILIYDCNVRDPGWHEVLTELQSIEDKSKAPALAVTSITPVQSEYEEVNRAGVRAFLPGEIQRRKLLQVMLTAMDERDLERLDKNFADLREWVYLIVNADRNRADEMKKMLGQSGIRNVDLALTGTEANAKVERLTPRVIIYDCNIKSPTWLELLDVFQTGRLKNPPPALVVTSGTPEQSEYDDVNRACIRAFLPGVVERRNLLQVILTAVEEQNFVMPGSKN